MTISSTTNKSGPYIENGVTTEFEYAFKIDDETHIQVVRAAGGVETILALGTHYTVTGVGNDKGNIVLVTPGNGSTLTLVRDAPFVQELDLENQGAYFAEQVEAALDLAVARDQQLAEKISRAVVVPISADATDLETLIGGVVQLLDSVDAVVTVAAISTQVVAVAANAVNINTVAANIVGVQTTADNITAILAAPGHASAAVAAASAAAAAAAETAADRVATGQDKTATAADRVQTGQDKIATAADRVATGQDRVATAADRVQTGLDRAAAAASAASVDVTSMDFRRNLWVNGSFPVSQENANTLGTASGYYPADQIALYFVASAAAMSVQRIQARTLANALDQIEFKTTTAKAGLALTDFVTLTQNIEGSSFAAAGFGTPAAKPLVLRAEVRLPAGLYHFHFANAANNRHCAVPFTITAGQANTPTVKEIVVPADTSGTWLTADGVIGITCDLVLAAGSGKTGGSASAWGGSAFLAASAQANILSSTANVARLADVGLKVDPAGAGVYGAYRVNEVDAVFRCERYWEALLVFMEAAVSAGAVRGYRASWTFPKCKTVTPAYSGTGTPVTIDQPDAFGFRVYNASGNSFNGTATANARLS